jgi:hypothetical protein
VVPLKELEKLHAPERKGHEVNLIVKIVQIIRRQDHQTSEVRVLDESNEIWFTEIFNRKFKWLREGQYVKIKSASVYDQEKES